ncbi:30S ribosomal protein THX [Pararcticibacter amylolyticus]|uniref:30S ribosomal protein THX n=1 Tax=Pararcticibacter amylolyticus TaxID=2173175 RepID=A0A2U2PLG2_9SPHI|nr:30S ribosomal protein THX [Pararcticibacter amylolyticus]PWG82240.1 30S ribosomal protein THX [Pararcticibacter amylolyticus]
MGKGDIKTKKGKITNKSFGKKRSHKLKKVASATQKDDE